jgi:hypothetical protein
VRLRRIKIGYINVGAFFNLLAKWIHFLHNRMNPSLIRYICTKKTSICMNPFDIKAVDLYCNFNLKKDFAVHTDAGVWCYIKGEYKVRKSFFTASLTSILN